MPVYNVQPSYTRYHVAAVVGWLDTQESYEIVTRNCEPSGGIAFGLAVGLGSSDYGGILGGSKFLGIAVRDPTLPRLEGSAVDVYLQNENMNVMTMGRCVVAVASAVSQGDPVYYNSTTGAFLNASGSGWVLIAGAQWRQTTAGAGMAALTLGIKK
jgi:hypothetical protein